MRFSLLFIALVVAGSAAEVNVGPSNPPAWVDLRDTVPLPPTPATDTSYGYDYLLLDRQVNVRETSSYYHNVYRITAESALQDGGRLTWTFDPAYQRLSVHHIRVIRDGVTEERMREGLIKTIQQERDLDRHLLNGELTGIAVLEDIRVGDVIDYAFTREGWNPAFDGHYFDAVSAGWSIPVRQQRFRVTAPADRPIRFKSHGNSTLALTESRTGNDQVLTWEARDLRPIESESELPSWFTPYPSVRLTEFNQWSDVVAWALPMYRGPEQIGEVLSEQATRLTRDLTDPAAKAAAILQFVQQEIRYLGMELGAGSYRPTDPAVVLARRFGDCKDKTLLFCTLMRAVGLAAHPALLDTDWRDTLDDWLPTPHAFDHVIACIPENGGYQWVDPTMTYQQGGLSRRGFPDYRRALVVKAGQTALTAIVVPPTARSVVRIEERFEIAAFDQPAKFDVTTTSTGLSADSQRRYFAQTTPEQIAKYYVNYYASAYPGLTSSSPPTIADDAVNNVVTVVEHYVVPKLWTAPDAAGQIKAVFYPKPISDYAERPKTTVRAMPLRISHPTEVELTTLVSLPEDWSVTTGERVVESPAFRAKEGISCAGKVVTMKYSWQSLAHFLPADQVTKHVEDLNRFRDNLGYTLTYTAPSKTPAPATAATTPGFRLNWKLLLIAITTFGAAAYGSTLAPRRDEFGPPLLAPANPKLTGLGGWLLLVGFGVTLRPFILLRDLSSSSLHTFDQAVWEAITTPGTAAYQSALGPMIVAETIGNTILLTGSVLLLVLFYRRKRAFPTVFIGVTAFSFVFLSLDAWAGAYLIVSDAKASAESFKGVAQAAGQALIWIPYMLVSERVKATFVH